MHTGDPANFIYVLHHVFAAGLDVGEEGDAVGYFLKVLDVKLDANRVGHGDEMQDGIS
jgi:hypothetical protein